MKPPAQAPEGQKKRAELESDDKMWGYDGSTQCIYRPTSVIQNVGRPWVMGDVVGCLANLDECRLRFYLNGQQQGDIVQLPAQALRNGITPSLRIHQGDTCTVMFRKENLRFKPDNCMTVPQSMPVEEDKDAPALNRPKIEDIASMIHNPDDTKDSERTEDLAKTNKPRLLQIAPDSIFLFGFKRGYGHRRKRQWTSFKPSSGRLTEGEWYYEATLSQVRGSVGLGWGTSAMFPKGVTAADQDSESEESDESEYGYEEESSVCVGRSEGSFGLLWDPQGSEGSHLEFSVDGEERPYGLYKRPKLSKVDKEYLSKEEYDAEVEKLQSSDDYEEDYSDYHILAVGEEEEEEEVKEEKTIGCLLNVDKKTVRFFVNGVEADTKPAYENFSIPPSGFFPVVSTSAANAVEVNLGWSRFKYYPKGVTHESAFAHIMASRQIFDKFLAAIPLKIGQVDFAGTARGRALSKRFVQVITGLLEKWGMNRLAEIITHSTNICAHTVQAAAAVRPGSDMMGLLESVSQKVPMISEKLLAEALADPAKKDEVIQKLTNSVAQSLKRKADGYDQANSALRLFLERLMTWMSDPNRLLNTVRAKVEEHAKVADIGTDTTKTAALLGAAGTDGPPVDLLEMYGLDEASSSDDDSDVEADDAKEEKKAVDGLKMSAAAERGMARLLGGGGATTSTNDPTGLSFMAQAAALKKKKAAENEINELYSSVLKHLAMMFEFGKNNAEKAIRNLPMHKAPDLLRQVFTMAFEAIPGDLIQRVQQMVLPSVHDALLTGVLLPISKDLTENAESCVAVFNPIFDSVVRELQQSPLKFLAILLNQWREVALQQILPEAMDSVVTSVFNQMWDQVAGDSSSAISTILLREILPCLERRGSPSMMADLSRSLRKLPGLINMNSVYETVLKEILGMTVSPSRIAMGKILNMLTQSLMGHATAMKSQLDLSKDRRILMLSNLAQQLGRNDLYELPGMDNSDENGLDWGSHHSIARMLMTLIHDELPVSSPLRGLLAGDAAMKLAERCSDEICEGLNGIAQAMQSCVVPVGDVLVAAGLASTEESAQQDKDSDDPLAALGLGEEKRKKRGAEAVARVYLDRLHTLVVRVVRRLSIEKEAVIDEQRKRVGGQSADSTAPEIPGYGHKDFQGGWDPTQHSILSRLPNILLEEIVDILPPGKPVELTKDAHGNTLPVKKPGILPAMYALIEPVVRAAARPRQLMTNDEIIEFSIETAERLLEGKEMEIKRLDKWVLDVVATNEAIIRTSVDICLRPSTLHGGPEMGEQESAFGRTRPVNSGLAVTSAVAKWKRKWKKGIAAGKNVDDLEQYKPPSAEEFSALNYDIIMALVPLVAPDALPRGASQYDCEKGSEEAKNKPPMWGFSDMGEVFDAIRWWADEDGYESEWMDEQVEGDLESEVQSARFRHLLDALLALAVRLVGQDKRMKEFVQLVKDAQFVPNSLKNLAQRSGREDLSTAFNDPEFFNRLKERDMVLCFQAESSEELLKEAAAKDAPIRPLAQFQFTKETGKELIRTVAQMYSDLSVVDGNLLENVEQIMWDAEYGGDDYDDMDDWDDDEVDDYDDWEDEDEEGFEDDDDEEEEEEEEEEKEEEEEGQEEEGEEADGDGDGEQKKTEQLVQKDEKKDGNAEEKPVQVRRCNFDWIKTDGDEHKVFMMIGKTMSKLSPNVLAQLTSDIMGKWGAVVLNHLGETMISFVKEAVQKSNDEFNQARNPKKEEKVSSPAVGLSIDGTAAAAPLDEPEPIAQEATLGDTEGEGEAPTPSQPEPQVEPEPEPKVESEEEEENYGFDDDYDDYYAEYERECEFAAKMEELMSGIMGEFDQLLDDISAPLLPVLTSQLPSLVSGVFTREASRELLGKIATEVVNKAPRFVKSLNKRMVGFFKQAAMDTVEPFVNDFRVIAKQGMMSAQIRAGETGGKATDALGGALSKIPGGADKAKVQEILQYAVQLVEKECKDMANGALDSFFDQLIEVFRDALERAPVSQFVDHALPMLGGSLTQAPMLLTSHPDALLRQALAAMPTKDMFERIVQQVKQQGKSQSGSKLDETKQLMVKAGAQVIESVNVRLVEQIGGMSSTVRVFTSRLKDQFRREADVVLHNVVDQSKAAAKALIKVLGADALADPVAEMKDAFDNKAAFTYAVTLARTTEQVKSKLGYPPISGNKIRLKTLTVINKRIARHIKEMFGVTAGQLAAALISSGFFLLAIFAFIFLGISVFRGQGAVKAVINTFLVAVGGVAANFKGKKSAGSSAGIKGSPDSKSPMEMLMQLTKKALNRLLEEAEDFAEFLNPERIADDVAAAIRSDPEMGRSVDQG